MLAGTLTASAEDAYIESTGAQLINTGYLAKPTTRVDVDFEVVEVVGNARVFGCNGDLYLDFCADTSDAHNEMWSFKDDSGNYAKFNSSQNDMVGVRRTLVIDGYQNRFEITKADGTVQASADIATTRTKTANHPLTIFTRSDATSGYAGGCYCKIKLYGFKISEAGELVHDYKPVIKGGTAGLLDSVTGAFLSDERTPYATTRFKYGGDIETVEDDPYIESTGTQRIETGYKAGPNTRIEADFAWAEVVGNRRAFGSDDGSASTLFVDYTATSADAPVEMWSFQSGNGNYTSTGIVCAQDVRHTVILDGYQNKIQVKTGDYCNYDLDLTLGHTNSCEMGLNLFSAYNNQGYNFGKVRFYGVKLYESGVLVHDLRPCLKGGKGAMRDEVTGTILESIGTDPLLYGGALEEYPADAYLESRGNQHLIRTDAYLSPDSAVAVDFMPVLAYPNSRVFGCRDGSVFWDYCSDTSANRNELWSCQDGSGGNYGSVGEPTAYRVGQRRTVVMDSYNSLVAVVHGLATNKVVQMTTTRTKTSTRPLEIFSARADDTAVPAYCSSNRIYSVKVYERGELVHDYRPYVKGGVPGLRDSLTGNFFSNVNVDNKDLVCGGEIESDGASKDAYVESDGTSVLDTGYYAKHNTKIEIDFATAAGVKNSRLFGNRGNLFFSLYTENADAMREGWCCQNSSGNWTTISPDQNSNKLVNQRRKAVIDGNANTFTMYDAAGTVLAQQTISTTHSNDSSVSMALFGLKADANTMAWQGKSRIYRVKLYEADVLVHDLVPYAENGQVGFYDTVTGGFVGKDSGLTLHGCGIDDQETMFVNTQTEYRIRYMKSATLSAIAPGASSYVWLKNGVEMDGVTGDTYDCAWERVLEPVVYTVIPQYPSVLGDYSTSGTPIEISVTNVPVGFTLSIR